MYESKSLVTNNKALALFLEIQNHYIFDECVLVGGTALSYWLNSHRISLDLDLAFTDKLPMKKIEDFINWLINQGHLVQFIPQNDTVRFDYEINCEDINLYQQDYIIDNNIRITFFQNNAKILKNKKKIASLDDLFILKSLLITKRAKTRDYFDLLTLYQYDETRFTPQKTIQAIFEYEKIFNNQNNHLLYHLQSISSNNDDEIICGNNFIDLKSKLFSLIDMYLCKST